MWGWQRLLHDGKTLLLRCSCSCAPPVATSGLLSHGTPAFHTQEKYRQEALMKAEALKAKKEQEQVREARGRGWRWWVRRCSCRKGGRAGHKAPAPAAAPPGVFRVTYRLRDVKCCA